ncbi:hypothetical protein [Nocardia salmonicida]|uniref:hypothetical protein n=1 Tax=Nocardia salmonicida TaxID=53431 RepID=UPI003791C353
MRFASDIWIRGMGTWYPPQRDTAAAAVAEGRLSAHDAALTGVSAVSVAVDRSAPEMAASAAELALERAECRAEDVDVLIHSWLYYQGHDLWSPPHYIANRIGADNCLPMSIHQGCDGGALAIQQAALRLTAVADENYALVTAADRFIEPGVDRWNCQPSLALGDVGTALVLTTSAEQPAPFRLEALRTRTTVAFEVMNRGSMPFGDYPMSAGMPADQRAVTDEAILQLGAEHLYNTARSQVYELLMETLEEAGISDWNGALQVIAMPRVGTNTLDAVYYPVFEKFQSVSKVRFDYTTGHLGCSDWAADLNDLYERDCVEPGRYAALIGAGGGFTWMCAIVKRFDE